MDPFALLGIERGADEAAIKRAYAQRLRKTRPDDDPEGFQRLNEAYRAALAHAQAANGSAARRRGTAWNRPVPVRVTADAADGPPASTSARFESDTPRPVHASKVRVVPLDPQLDARRAHAPTFDPATFIAEFREHCANDDARAMSRWLNQHPAFWNLPTKHAAGRLLLRTLFEQPEHMSEACFAAMSEFFNFDDALAGIDPLLLRRVRERGTLAWLVRSENHAVLAARVYGRKTPKGVRHIRSAIRHSSGSRRLWRDLLFALPPGRAPRHAALLLRMCNGNLDDLPPPIVKDHARFWIEAGGPTIGKAKLLTYVARTIAALLLIPVAIALFIALVGYTASTQDYLKFAVNIAVVLLVITLVVAAIVWACIGTGWFIRMLDSLGARSRRVRIALFSLTPTLCCMALLVAALVDPVLGVLAAITVLAIAFLRSRSGVRRRRVTSSERLAAYAGVGLVSVMLGGILSAMSKLAVSTGAANVVPTVAIVVIALGIWAWDWRKRGFLQPRM